MTEKQNDKDLHIQRLFHQIQFLKAIPIGTVFTMGEQSDTDSYHKDNKTKRKLKLVNILPHYMRFYDEKQKFYISYTFQEVAVNGKIETADQH